MSFVVLTPPIGFQFWLHPGLSPLSAVVACQFQVEESEISALQTLVSSGLPAEPWPYLEVGQRVRIEDPAPFGVEGILIRFKGVGRIVLSVSLLRRSVALEIDRVSVRPARSIQEAGCGSASLAVLGERVTA